MEQILALNDQIRAIADRLDLREYARHFNATRDQVYNKILSNIDEVRYRRGRVIAIVTEGDTIIGDKMDHFVYIPDIDACRIALLSVISL